MNLLRYIFVSKQQSVRSAAFVLASMVLVSRVFGLIRDRLLASRFSPDELGVYFAAFRIPNFMFELLVMGALTSAFIPVYTRFLVKNRENEANNMASTVCNIASVCMFLLAVPIIIWAPAVSRIIAPGFNESQIQLMAEYTRFMIVFQVLPLLIGNFFTGILQSYTIFIIPALAPVIYNVGIISVILLAPPTLGLLVPVVGVGVGAILFMVIQIPSLWIIGYRHRWKFSLKTEGVKDVFRLMGPRTIGLAVSQIDTTVDLMLSSLLGARMVTIFNFAQHLQQLPVGLFGTAVAQAALPALSSTSATDDHNVFKKTLIVAMHQILFFVLPTSMLLIILRIPIVRLVFGADRFDWEATVLTGMTVSCFAISLFAQSLLQIITRGFYALYDSKTPVIVGIITIILNTGLSIISIQVYHLPIWSLGIATSIASIIHLGILSYLLIRRVGGIDWSVVVVPIVKMIVATVVTGFALYVPLKLFDQLVFDTTRTFGLILLTGLAGLSGMGTYIFLAWVMEINEVSVFISMVNRIRQKKIMFEPAGEIVNGGVESNLP